MVRGEVIDRHGKGARGQRPVGRNTCSHAEDGLGIRHRPCNAREPASGLDLRDEVELLRRGGAAVFDLDGSEHGELLPHHVRGDGDGAVADEI